MNMIVLICCVKYCKKSVAFFRNMKIYIFKMILEMIVNQQVNVLLSITFVLLNLPCYLKRCTPSNKYVCEILEV